MNTRPRLFAASLAMWLSVPAPAAERHTADVVVYGATASGVVAAVTVAREGKSVILLDPARHVGGMVSGGLGATDTGRREAIGGYSREFFDRVRAHYVTKYGPNSRQVKDCVNGFRFEPHVASLVFAAMLREVRVEPRLDRPLSGVTKDVPAKSASHPSARSSSVEWPTVSWMVR